MKSIQALILLSSIVVAFSTSNDHVAQKKNTEFERFYLAEYERKLRALIEIKVSSVCSWRTMASLVDELIKYLYVVLICTRSEQHRRYLSLERLIPTPFAAKS